MDPLDNEYLNLLQQFSDLQLPNNPGMLDCCIWWIYQLNNITDEKPSRNFTLRKMINDIEQGFLSNMFWKKQRINFESTETDKCLKRKDAGDNIDVGHVELLTKQKTIIELQNTFIRVWLPGYLNILRELLKRPMDMEEIMQELHQYDIEGFKDFKKTKHQIKQLINEIWLKSKVQPSIQSLSCTSDLPAKHKNILKNYEILKHNFKKLAKNNKKLIEYYERRLEAFNVKEQQHSTVEDLADELENRYRTIFNKNE